MFPSYCLDIAPQLMNVETCSKTCARFLPVWHHLKSRVNYKSRLTTLNFLSVERDHFEISVSMFYDT